MSDRHDQATGGGRPPGDSPGGRVEGRSAPGRSTVPNGPAPGSPNGSAGTGPNGSAQGVPNGTRGHDAGVGRGPSHGQGTEGVGEPAGDRVAPPSQTASAAAPGGAEATLDELVVPEVDLTDPAALAAERDEYLGALQRLKADFDNFRKRVVRQQEEQADRAASDLVGKLLPVLDTLDLAVAHLGNAGEDAVQAVQALGQARAQLIDVLAKEGLQRVDETDVAFDPAVHDAVAHAPAGEADGPDTLVDEVMRSGYRWRGHVLRAAMVRVRG